MTWLTSIPSSILEEFFTDWITLPELGLLDIALCTKKHRDYFLSIIRQNHLIFQGIYQKGWENYTKWLDKRELSVKELSVENIYFLSQMKNTVKVCGRLESLSVQWCDCDREQEFFKQLQSKLYRHYIPIKELSLPDCSNYSALHSIVDISLLSSLNLQNSYQILDDRFLMLLSHVPLLQALNISSNSLSSYTILIEISRLCPNLRSFHLMEMDFHHQSNEVVQEWIVNFQCLTSLNLSKCIRLAASDICLLIRRFTELEELYLGNLMTSGILQVIEQIGPPLSVLDFSNSSSNLSAGVNQYPVEVGIFHAPPQPAHPQSFLEIQFRNFFPFFSTLRSLNLSNNYIITDVHLIIIVENCTDLVELNLKYCSRLTEDSFLAIGKCCRHLKKINFAYCDLLSDFALTMIIDNCSELKELILTYCLLLTDYCLIYLVELHESERAGKLKVLGISGCHHFTEAGFFGLIVSSLIKQLDILDLSDNPWINWENMEVLFSKLHCLHLKKLYFGYCSNFLVTRFSEDEISSLNFWKGKKKSNLEFITDSICE